MRLKKMCTALLSGIITFGAMAVPLPNGTGLFSIKNIAVTAEAASAMRRPCDPDHPMLIVHIDTWNTADPAKIIATIPEDIKPYCVFNISMSINWSNDKHEWLMTQDGYELAKSSKPALTRAYGAWFSLRAADSATSPTMTHREIS